jgi:hypothetical protein
MVRGASRKALAAGGIIIISIVSIQREKRAITAQEAATMGLPRPARYQTIDMAPDIFGVV